MSRFFPAALAITAALSPCHALAQQANQPSVQLLEVVVTPQPEASGLTAPSTATLRRQVNRTAGSVGFVDAKTYKDSYANTLRDALKDAPGVYVQNRYSQELRLSIRGAGMTRAYHTRGLEILQDGIPTNLADGSGDYYQIDPLGLRAFEIYKGGNALSFGTSTLGGAINAVTPTARTAGFANEIRIDGGSFGTGRLHGQASKVLGDWDFLASGTLTHADGWRGHETQRSGQFNANIGYRISPSLETRFYFGAYIFDQKLPGTLSLGDALHNPHKASAAARSGDQARNSETYRLANRTSLRLEHGQIDIDSWFIHKDLYHPIFQALDQRGATFGVAPRYTGRFEIGGFRNDLIVGARAYGGTNPALQFVNLNGRRGAQTLDARQNAANYEVFAENRFFFVPKLALMTGLKLLDSERDYLDHGGLPTNPTPKAASKRYRTVNPKIGLLFEPRPDIQVFADITRSADVPDFTDLTQTIGTTGTFVPLRLQHAWTAEIGTRGRAGPLTWDATVYRARVRDEMLNYTVDPSIPAATFNAPRTVHQGVELSATLELTNDLTGAGDSLSFSQVYTYSDFRFENDRQYGGNRLAGAPEHVLRSTLRYRRPNGFYLSPSLDWVLRGGFVDYANTQRAPGYALIGLQTGMDFSNGVSLFVDARNLANRHYISDFATVTRYTPSYASFYPGSGRSVFAGLRYRW
jgi:iron complex outermembrane receptor protein